MVEGEPEGMVISGFSYLGMCGLKRVEVWLNQQDK